MSIAYLHVARRLPVVKRVRGDPTKPLWTKPLWTEWPGPPTIGPVASLEHDARAASIAFGKRVRTLREAKGMSQDGLSHATDIHPTAIGRIERGAREPRLTTILRLARGLDCPPGDLTDPLAR